MLMALQLQIRGSLMGSIPFQIAIPEYAQLYLDGKLKLDEMIDRKSVV